MSYTMTKEQIENYERNLRLEERSEATVHKYGKAIVNLYDSLPESKEITKEQVIAWKNNLEGKHAASTVNVMISAVNTFFAFMGWDGLRIKQIKTQRNVYREPQREMTREDYMKLLDAAMKAGNLRLYYLMMTLASTGIRISELRFITVEALKCGIATVNCKGKQRKVFIPKALRRKLLAWCRETGIVSGPVFVSKRGNPLNRSNIWREMHKLCKAAGVDAHKVFPHNFRHLFAVTYYRQEKDVAKLADLLGHASIETTRIYIMESGEEHERQMERLGLVV